MPEARHSMHLSDARQTSPLPANAPLPHRSVCPPDLDLRQVLRASEGRGHQIESSSNLGSGWHPWRLTGALGRVPGSRLEASAAVGGTASMKDLVGRRIPHRRVRPDLVIPALEARQGGAETAALERYHFACKVFFFGGADDVAKFAGPLHRDQMPAQARDHPLVWTAWRHSWRRSWRRWRRARKRSAIPTTFPRRRPSRSRSYHSDPEATAGQDGRPRRDKTGQLGNTASPCPQLPMRRPSAPT